MISERSCIFKLGECAILLFGPCRKSNGNEAQFKWFHQSQSYLYFHEGALSNIVATKLFRLKSIRWNENLKFNSLIVLIICQVLKSYIWQGHSTGCWTVLYHRKVSLMALQRILSLPTLLLPPRPLLLTFLDVVFLIVLFSYLTLKTSPVPPLSLSLFCYQP